MDIYTFQGSIALRYGLVDAILLERMRQWFANVKLDVDGFVKNGNLWIPRTTGQFLADCPFFSPYHVRTALTRLENEKLILVNRNDVTGKLRRVVADYALTDKAKAWLNFKEE